MTSRVRVAMVVNNLNVGGLEKVVVSLLNNLDRSRYEPFLICLDGPGLMADNIDLPANNRLVLHKDPTRRLPVVGANIDIALVRAIRSFVKANRIQLLHAHNLAPLVYSGISTRLLPMFGRPALVYSEHNQVYSASPKQRQRLRSYLRLADQIVAVSRDLRKTLVDQVKAPADKVTVLYNGIDGTRFALQDRSKVRRELGLSDSDFVIGTAVVLSEQKGIRYLLEAAARVKQRAPEAKFLIGGDGPKRAELEELARELALGDTVRFLGYRKDVPDLISSLDVYVLPSLWEGLPLALIEAMAIGKPIVCTSVGGNPEIVEDEVNGFVVSPRDSAALADRILRLNDDPQFGGRVRERNVAKFRECFSLESMIRGHEHLFDQLTR